jgi:cytidylate kinase
MELQEKADCPTYEEIRADIIARDYNDTHREIAPLKQAEDAVLIDTTDMGFHEVCEEILSLIETRLKLED